MGVPIRWTDESDAGVFLFNRREFWSAHEAWEAIWKVGEPAERKFYQGLIQVAAGFVKVQRREHAGALANLGKGLERFRELEVEVGPVEVPILYRRLVEETQAIRASLREQGAEALSGRAWEDYPVILYRGREG
ncbi:MAG: DUF309 domain-containing protein, partial [Nitrospinota bacterium]